ncbi:MULTISPECIES: HD family hydrolase [unclassified Roseitalea]|uniref:HD family hydrolase n=1 Tax=unclassified Roseitalea TaxID=2639107 RepID=UPI00273E3084|nr:MULTISPECIES: HD family hydrolase [unclassified Roseitalea]
MPDRDSAPPRAWQRMLSGRRLDLLDPSPLDVEISDIAHGLARVARWNGQTFGPHAFSVGQHCLLVEDIVRRLRPGADHRTLLMALLHDGPEYVIGDMISPFKHVMGGDYRAVEQRLQAAIHLRFSLPAQTPQRTRALIKRADQIAAFYEATHLAGFSRAEAHTYFGRPRDVTPDALPLEPQPADAVETAFLARFRALEAGAAPARRSA